jgi:uncharacterized SAM-dependent methyltransferase
MNRTFERDVLEGLAQRQKSIPAHWLDGTTIEAGKRLLMRINSDLDADFAPTAFRHETRLDAQAQRREWHLVSCYTQHVNVRGRRIQFAMNESIRTATFDDATALFSSREQNVSIA